MRIQFKLFSLAAVFGLTACVADSPPPTPTLDAAAASAIERIAQSDASAKAHFSQIRDMVIFGYYTSEVASEELAYEEYPGRFDGCVPLSEIGAAWLDRGV